MKTWSYIISAVILLTSVSCTLIEESHKHEVSIKMVQENRTKTGTTTPLTYSTFGLFANLTEEAAGADCSLAWGKSQDKYFDNKCFLKTPESDPCYLNADFSNPSQLVHTPLYWPGSGSLMFSAYAPHSSQNACIKDVQYVRNSPVTDQSRFEIKVVLREQPTQRDLPTIINQGGKDPLDLLWVDTRDINQNRSLGNQAEPVPLIFKHAMTKVTFKFYNDESEFKLKARLINCVNSATFYSGTTAGWQPTFKDPNLLAEYELFASDVELSSIPQEVSIITLPMQLNGIYTTGTIPEGDVILELEASNKDGIGHEKKQYKLAQCTEITAWEKTKQYIYHIRIKAHGIEFDEPEIILR